jgi:hypothetical protein
VLHIPSGSKWREYLRAARRFVRDLKPVLLDVALLIIFVSILIRVVRIELGW